MADESLGVPVLKTFKWAAKLVDSLEDLIENPNWKEEIKIADARMLKQTLGELMAAKKVIYVGDVKDIKIVRRLKKEFWFSGEVVPDPELSSEKIAELAQLVKDAFGRVKESHGNEGDE